MKEVNKPNIGIVLETGYPEEIRLTKEAELLIPHGYKHFLLCAKRKGEVIEDVADGIQITRIWVGYSNPIKALISSFNTLFWWNPFFARALDDFIKKNKIDVLIVHDLPLVKTVIRKAKKYKCEVILDMHENYPAGLQVWKTFKKNPLVKIKNALFFRYEKWLRYEKWACQHVDHILTVVKEMTQRLTTLHHIDPSTISTITNAGSIKFEKNAREFPELMEKYREKYLITYVGSMGPHRGLDTVVKALPMIKEKLPNVLFLLVGSGSVHSALMNIAKELGVESHVEFAGRVPFEHVYTYMKHSQINIIPHHRNEHTDHTIPHKLFQAMMTGQPVVVSSSVTLKRIIEETKGGFYFEASNPTSLCECIEYIYENPKIAEERAQNAMHHTLEGEYNWENNEELLLDLFKKIERRINNET